MQLWYGSDSLIDTLRQTFIPDEYFNNIQTLNRYQDSLSLSDTLTDLLKVDYHCTDTAGNAILNMVEQLGYGPGYNIFAQNPYLPDSMRNDSNFAMILKSVKLLTADPEDPVFDHHDLVVGSVVPGIQIIPGIGFHYSYSGLPDAKRLLQNKVYELKD